MPNDISVLVTGDRGYIGSVLTEILSLKGYKVCGFDTSYFGECCLSDPFSSYQQFTGDIRSIDKEFLSDFDCVIHLAGLSNDPLGELSPDLTLDINYKATIRLASLAKEAGVSRFVYASSQSMYGVSHDDQPLDEDNSLKRPVTAYAKTKWDAEVELKKLNNQDFTVSCFRPSTVFGVSPRLRTDIVFNNLVACAFTTGTIEIKSDGTPWRPVVHIRDVCSAFIAGLEAPRELVSGRSYNVGIPNGNFTVRQLAEAAQESVVGSSLCFTGEHGSDSRTYRVSFDRILTELRDFYQPSWDLKSGGKELFDYFTSISLTESDFRGSQTVRLSKLQSLISAKLLDDRLYWSA